MAKPLNKLKIFLSLGFILSFQLCHAQQYPGLNAVSIEAFGVSGTASFNYEHNFIGDRRKKFTMARIGIGVNHFTQSLTIPHGLTFNFPVRKNFIEAGLLGALTSANTGSKASLYYLAPCLGYRSPGSRSRLFFRVYATVLVPLDPELEVVPYFGLGLGRTFK